MKLLHFQSIFGGFASPTQYETPGAGGGGAAAGGSSVAGGAAAAGTPAAIKLTGDSLVDLGDGQPIKWSDATNAQTGRFMPRDAYDRGVQYLTAEAQRLQTAWDKYHAGQGARPSKPEPQPQTDPLAGIDDNGQVTGAQLRTLYKQLQANGLTPIAQVIAQMAGRLQQLEGGLGKVGQVTGAISQRDQNATFETFISDSFTNIGAVKGLPEGVSFDAKSPNLREWAKDIYLSHEAESWKPGEFVKTLRGRLEGLITEVRALDKKAVEVATEKRRNWVAPRRGGEGRPSGDVPFKFEKGAQIAKRWFNGAPLGT